ncbi:TonB-dependent receptor plug domain-containing protein [Undibacterium sp.]|jgi:outer membrane receptor for ferrienterochelin and colicins|uniref:TonB-dependent receptor plug domain-containing protein n=1 Tax=Undibacterium sp. TaxID=1914977 RepID=UPI002CD17CFF|nr:TonB-dependent receptor [Undibacterium sp.]HTD05973.1 TonB-dependent receptor [Undibacterium sp.]
MHKKINSIWGLLLASSSALAQQAGQVQTAVQEPQQVVVNGAQTDIEAGRDFVAGKLIIGRKQIEQSGLQNVTEILKREPAISLGKDGRIGLLGLPGYTQILLDGHPPMGKSPLELDLTQVDKIEIIKSATAETGPFGIAGTINVISRKIERKNLQQVRLGATETAGEYGGNGAWTLNQFSPDSPWSLSLNVNARRNRSPSSGIDEQILLSGTGLQPQYSALRSAVRMEEFVALAGELAYKLGVGNNLSIKPDYGQFTLEQTKNEQRNWSGGRVQQAYQRTTSPLSGYSLPMSWSYDAAEAGQLDASMRFNQMQNKSDTLRLDQDSSTAYAMRRQQYSDDQSNYVGSLNYRNSFSGGHSFKSGLQWTHHSHDINRTFWLNDQPDGSLSLLGGQSLTREDKRRIFVQDDWRFNKTLALNGGLAMEDQVVDMDEGGTRNQSRFRVWSPSMHLSKKLEGDQKRQFRASLARSFRAPDSNQLMLQPGVNPFAPCVAPLGCGSNTVDTADSMGNPGLQPERALAFNLSYEHGLSSNSQISVEAYSRQIERKIGSELLLTNVSWASVPRYVQRPANLGSASIQGINIDWRIALPDFWKAAPKLDLRGGVGWAHSVLSDLPGPDNHLEGQLPWRAKIGMSYAMEDLPVKIDLDANWLPADWLRNNLTLRTYESRHRTLTANAIWTVNPKLRLIMNVDNMLAPQSETFREYLIPGASLQTRSQNASHTRVGVRMELNL